jgi:ankyrin repeat protein
MRQIDSDLFLACKKGDIEGIKVLIANGADVNAKGDYNLTPLHEACTNKNIDVARILIEKGADVNAMDRYGRAVLYSACGIGDIDMVKLLIEKGADVNKQNQHGESAILFSCNHDDTAIVQCLIDNGADVNTKDRPGNTPLAKACDSDRAEIAELLIDKGAAIDEKSKGNTPLIIACLEGSIRSAKLLIQKGANIDVKDQDGKDLLDIVCRNMSSQIIGSLIKRSDFKSDALMREDYADTLYDKFKVHNDQTEQRSRIKQFVQNIAASLKRQKTDAFLLGTHPRLGGSFEFQVRDLFLSIGPKDEDSLFSDKPTLETIWKKCQNDPKLENYEAIDAFNELLGFIKKKNPLITTEEITTATSSDKKYQALNAVIKEFEENKIYPLIFSKKSGRNKESAVRMLYPDVLEEIVKQI